MSFNIQFESEKRVFECIVKNPDLMHDVDIDWLSTKGKEVYNAIGFLYDNKKSINPDTLCIQTGDEELRDFFVEVFSSESDIRDFPVYVERLKADYVRDLISIKLSDDLKVLVNRRGELDFAKVEELSNLLNHGLDLINGRKSDIPKISEVTKRYSQELTDRANGKFFSYGDALLDKVTVGAQPGQMTCLFGPTSMGKSAYALNLFNKQINKRIPTVYFTLEMDEISTMDRLISLRTGIPASDLLMRDCSEEEKIYISEVVQAETEKLNKFEDRMFIVDAPGLKLSEFEQYIVNIKKKMGVDYLIAFVDLWTMFADIRPEASDIEQAINLTHEIVMRQGIHLIPVVQANREADKKPVPNVEMISNMKIRNIQNIKNSAAIGERCRTVISVFRAKKIAEQYFPEDPITKTMDDIFESTVIKCSNGKIGHTIKYIYEPECFKITPYFETVEEDYATPAV